METILFTIENYIEKLSSLMIDWFNDDQTSKNHLQSSNNDIYSIEIVGNLTKIPYYYHHLHHHNNNNHHSSNDSIIYYQQKTIITLIIWFIILSPFITMFLHLIKMLIKTAMMDEQIQTQNKSSDIIIHHSTILHQTTTTTNEKKCYPYQTKTVIIKNTCSKLYKKYYEEQKYRNKSKCSLYSQALDGLNIEIEYADTIDMIQDNKHGTITTTSTNNNNNNNRPITILALHGAPGSHEDFEPFIKYFQQKQIRFIVPNYPDFNITIQTNVFRHSAEEKFELIKDFLHAINVNEIDLLLSHSSSIYPTTKLLYEQDIIKIHSVAFLNPAGHRRIKAMRPAWFTEGSVKVYQNKLGRLIYNIFGKSFIKITGTVLVKPDSMMNVILSAQTMRYSNYKELDKYLKKLKESKMPTLWVMADNDGLIEKEINYEMIDMMGVKYDYNIQKYDSNGKMVMQFHPESNMRVMLFQNGGHYAFLKYSQEVIKECDRFLNFVLNKSSNNTTNNSTQQQSPTNPSSCPMAKSITPIMITAN